MEKITVNRRHHSGTAVIAGLLFASAILSGCAQGSETGQTTEPPPELLEASEGYLVPLVELREMSQAEITELATIPSASVQGPDGQIDWVQYATRLAEITELGTMAGTTRSEMRDMYLSDDSGTGEQEVADYYDQAFIPGFATTNAYVDNYKQVHLSFIGAAFSAYLLDSDPVARTDEVLSVEVLQSSDSSATLLVSKRATDNYFSSGIFSATDPKDVEDLGGRTEDMDVTYEVQIDVVTIGGNLYLDGGGYN